MTHTSVTSISRSSRVLLLAAATLVVAASMLAGPAVSARESRRSGPPAVTTAPTVNGRDVGALWHRVSSFRGAVVEPGAPLPTTPPPSGAPAASGGSLGQTVSVAVYVAEPYCRSEVESFNRLAAATPEALWPSAAVPHWADADWLCEVSD